MNEDIALLEGEFARPRISVVKHVAIKDDVRAMAFGLDHFDRRSRLRHDDGRRDSEALCVIGDGLGMVAGGCRNDAARPFFGRELQQFVERAALLVGSGELQVLELQPDIRTNGFGQGTAAEHRGAYHRAVDPLGSGANVVDRRNVSHRRAT